MQSALAVGDPAPGARERGRGVVTHATVGIDRRDQAIAQRIEDGDLIGEGGQMRETRPARLLGPRRTGAHRGIEPIADDGERFGLERIARVAPDVVVASNPGCLMHMVRGAAEAGQTARIVHLVELLDSAYPTGA